MKERIHQAFRPHQQPDGELLAAISVDELLSCLHDREESWWLRQQTAMYLRGKLQQEDLSRLIELAQDVSEEEAVRGAVLETVCAADPLEQRGPLLSWMQSHVQGQSPGKFDISVLAGRAELGDVSAARPLMDLAYDEWWHRRRAGEAALDTLATRVGLDAVLQELGHPSARSMAARAATPQERLSGVRFLLAAGEDVTEFLVDPERTVARHVYDALAEREVNVQVLRDIAGATERPQEARVWALCALCRAGHAIDDYLASLPEPRIALEVPDDVRAAILREYAPGQPGTDPRWLLEHALECDRTQAEVSREAATEALLPGLIAALAEEGFAPQEAISAAEHFRQGRGTYFLIPVSGGHVQLSTLGPFVGSDSVDDEELQQAVEAGGELTWIAPALAATEFAGLSVYSFGHRKPMSVWDLLFFWMD